MKKYICLLSAAFLVHGALAQDETYNYTEMAPGLNQYDPNNFSNNFGIYVAAELIDEATPVPSSDAAAAEFGSDPSLIGTYYLNGGAVFDSSGTHKSTIKANSQYNPIVRDPSIQSGKDLWLRDQSQITNSTVGSGESSYLRGDEEPEITLFLRHNLVGRFLAVDNDNNNSDSTDITTIIGLDDPTVSSWTGKAIDRGNARQRTADNAVTILHVDRLNDRNMGSFNFTEGTYLGGEGFSGLYVEQATDFIIRGASFIGGSAVGSEDLVEEAAANGYAAIGAYFENVKSVDISNRTDVASDRFQGGNLGARSLRWNGNGLFGKNIDYSGGDGLFVWAHNANQPATKVTISGGDFIGSQVLNNNERSIEFTVFDMVNNTLDGTGGDAVALYDVGAVNISAGNFIGGDATATTLGGPDSEVLSNGGSGLWLLESGTTAITGGNFVGGRSAAATMLPGGYWDSENLVEVAPTDANSLAIASGGNGITLLSNGATTIGGATVSGAAGSIARAFGSSTRAAATGGSGVFAYDTAVTINSGTFTGGDGGTATGGGIVDASGGAGAYVVNQALAINGGTFRGGEAGKVNGEQAWGDAGVWVENANLTIAQASTNAPTLVDGHVFINNLTGQSKTASITGGTITGDIYLFGAGTTAVTISTNASYNGSFAQFNGTVNVNLGNTAQGKFFSDVLVDNGTFNLNGAKFTTAENARFVLGNGNSQLNVASGMDLSKGSSIETGFGNMTINGGNLNMGENSTISFSFNDLTGDRGSLKVSAGSLVASNANAQVVARGSAASPTGSFKVVDSPFAVVKGARVIEDIVEIDMGWLTKLDSIDDTAGIVVDWVYNSLTNSALNDEIDPSLLLMVDNTIVNLSSNEFYNLNNSGAAKGTSLFRYSLSQMPDVSESAFEISQQVNGQIAARGTEFRSMNGFASSKPDFGRKNRPTGAAGPTDIEKDTLQGWIRAYGAMGNKDRTANFTSYDSSTWGTVIGLDKSFEHILLGIAGGYARTDLDAGQIYQADVDTYHGSIYSTIGGESVYVDLAATIGTSETKSGNDATKDKFDSYFTSLYAGIGKRFDVKEKIAITPEASFLHTYYKQEDYSRVGLLAGTEIDEYDTSSSLSSLGVNISTLHQMDWMNRGLAFIPEVRLHWLHEFEDDPDNFTYNVGGSSYTFGVRPRDEDILRLGVGFDVWSWKYQSTKFEVDYDGLYSDTYREHVVSGKITVKF